MKFNPYQVPRNLCEPFRAKNVDLSQPGSANLSEEHFCLNLGLEPTTDGHLWSYTVPVRHSN